MARAGDAFAARSRSGGDSFRPGRPITGFYPSKGKGWGQPGEMASPDLLTKWDKDQGWTAWRAGMKLAFNELFRDREQFVGVQVLRLPVFRPQLGWQAAAGVLVGFPSETSPEGRWTVAVRPRGTEISPRPLRSAVQREVLSEVEGMPRRLLEVNVTGAWLPGSLAAASYLIGELVEDTAIDQSTVVDDDEDPLILQCVAVYPERGLLVFDGTRRWARRKLPSGRRLLRPTPIGAQEPLPRFRSGRHLTQSTSISCNCPNYLGLEYARLRNDVRAPQALFPQPGAQAPQQFDPLDGVARRFLALDWRRDPSVGCKHCHAVRFALGCPLEEPSDYVSLASDYWSAVEGMAAMEELQAPLAHPKFIDTMRRRMLNDAAYRDLRSTISTGSIGDAFGAAPARIRLLPPQVSSLRPEPDSALLRFNEQQATVEPQAAEQAVLGDVWIGRGVGALALPFIGPGETLEAPLVERQRDDLPPIYG